jgi:HEPN domain-containing protein
MELVEEWFDFASNDLIAAKHLFEDVYPKQLAISCFHSQQAAEKALKGFLVSKGIIPPKIHDLKALCKLCIEKDSSFDAIADISAKLTIYGVASRYPGEMTIDETIAKIVITRAQTIYDFCLSKIPELRGCGNEGCKA